MLDYDAILDKFVAVAREPLVADLSFIGQNNDIPAVIRARSNGVKPDYPYVVTDITDERDEDGWVLNQYLESNQETYVTPKQLIIAYTVFGGQAISLANKLHGYFRRDSVRGSFRTDLEGSIVNVLNIVQRPLLIADQYVESATFNIIFNINDIDTFSGDLFDTINVDGTNYSPTTTEPILTNLSVSSNTLP